MSAYQCAPMRSRAPPGVAEWEDAAPHSHRLAGRTPAGLLFASPVPQPLRGNQCAGACLQHAPRRTARRGGMGISFERHARFESTGVERRSSEAPPAQSISGRARERAHHPGTPRPPFRVAVPRRALHSDVSGARPGSKSPTTRPSRIRTNYKRNKETRTSPTANHSSRLRTVPTTPPSGRESRRVAARRRIEA